jgi:uncharacterized protein
MGANKPEWLIANVKNLVFRLIYLVILLTVGCSHSRSVVSIETGRGIFISTNNEAITAIYSTSDNGHGLASVQLLFPDGTRKVLYQAMSGSGARYTNDTAVWWEHQGEATYDESGTNSFRGAIQSSK